MTRGAGICGSESEVVRDARKALDVRRLALAIHDASLPGGGDDDVGRGAPGSPASLRLAAFAARAGFDALQVGPGGLTSDDDASPYMGTLFSRNPLSIPLARLADPDGEWGELVPATRLAAWVAERRPGAERRMSYPAVARTQRAALGVAFERFERRRAAGDERFRQLEARLAEFGREAGAWLRSDALYEVLRNEYRGRDWQAWEGPRADLDRALGDASRRDGPREARRAELARRYAPALRFYEFVQFVAHAEHARFRDELHGQGLELLGDLQIGVSARDAWRLQGIFLEGYRLGAPPSRTNPEGQPWDYPVLDPDLYRTADGAADGPVLEFVTHRILKMFAEYDAVRVDHPQGLVCPWVYRSDDPDPVRAVQRGARLFSSPDLAEHPALARYAIVRSSQLAASGRVPRYDDGWVESLEHGQIEQYALLLDRIVDVARRHGHAEPPLLCEVLSTLPRPLACVLARHDLGRFRVTQKADPGDPGDVYRAENAEPHDWIMFGNHDTPPLWRLLDQWRTGGTLGARAAHAASCLEPVASRREAFRARLLDSPGLLAHAEVAQLFTSPAAHVAIFFADFFGLTDVYNRPGVVSDENWRLRLEPDWERTYAARLRGDRAINLPLALWLALRARPDTAPSELARALREEAERVRDAPVPL